MGGRARWARLWLPRTPLLVWLPSGVETLALLLSEMTSGAQQQLGPLKEGDPVDIECQPNVPGAMIIWFRVLDNAGMEFIASLSNGVKRETESKPSSSFSYGKTKSHKVTLDSFRRQHDSGLYGCSALIKGKELQFGPLTRLFGGEFSDDTGTPEKLVNRPSFSSAQKQWLPTPPSLTPLRASAQSRLLQRARATAAGTRVSLSGPPQPGQTPMATKPAFFQGEWTRRSSARRCCWARWSAAAAFFCSSSSSPLCTATVSDLQS